MPPTPSDALAPTAPPGTLDAPEQRLIASLGRVRQIALEEHRSDLIAAIDEELEHLSSAGPITVVVAAEVSRGKSLLINALIGEEGLLPVDVDVSTGVYVVVRHGEQPGLRVFTQASPEPITAGIDAIDQWVSVGPNPGNAAGVSYVEVSVPSALLGEGISFIDTPGVGGLDTTHGQMTLAALSGADALIFVLDASAPLSRPELNFLVKAAQRIQSVILVLTKTDVFTGWRSILDEDRKLLQQFAPRFADKEILPVRSPIFFQAARKRAEGDEGTADRFLEKSGIPLLAKRLREDLLQRSNNIRLANGHRLALSVVWQLDSAYKAELATLNGDTSPLQALQGRQKELAEQKRSSEVWRQAAMRGFADVTAKLTRELQEAMAGFREKFDTEIATAWRPERHLSFPSELEADLHLVGASLQHQLADHLRECAGEQASQLKIDELSAPAATLALPERERLAVRPVGANKEQLMAAGTGLLVGALGLLRSVLTANPLYVLSGALGAGTSIANLKALKTQRRAAEQAEARRLLQAYVEHFQRDCKAAIDTTVQAAADTTIAALQTRIQNNLQALQAQIDALNRQTAQIKEAEAARTTLAGKRARIAKLEEENQASFREAMTTTQGGAP
jgi:hypothetical protein